MPGQWLRSIDLGRCEGAEGDEHGGINSTAVEEESSNNLLESGEADGVEGRRGVVKGGKLNGSAVVGSQPFVGRRLGSIGCRMLETVKGSFEVAGHGDVAGSINVVPFESEAKVFGTSLVGGDAIFDCKKVQQGGDQHVVCQRS